jgi:hypothetical protein
MDDATLTESLKQPTHSKHMNIHSGNVWSSRGYYILRSFYSVQKENFVHHSENSIVIPNDAKPSLSALTSLRVVTNSHGQPGGVCITSIGEDVSVHHTHFKLSRGAVRCKLHRSNYMI